jgi:hypothetical protein
VWGPHANAGSANVLEREREESHRGKPSMRENPVYGSRPTLMEPQGHVGHNREGVFQVVHVPHKSAQAAQLAVRQKAGSRRGACRS